MKQVYRRLRAVYGFTKAILGHAEWISLPGAKTLNLQHQAWSHDSILALQTKKWNELSRALATDPDALSINHEAPLDTWGGDIFFQNQILCFAHALALAAIGKSHVAWLDYGGGLGQYYLYAKTLFPNLSQDYTCYDLPVFCEAGQAQNPEGHYLSEKAMAMSGLYDLVFAGSSLWYDNAWEDTLGQLARCASPYLMVARQLMVEKAPSFVAIQRPSHIGYLTEYQCWILNKSEFLKAAITQKFELVREYYLGDGPYIHNAPESAKFVSFLFRAADKKRAG